MIINGSKKELAGPITHLAVLSSKGRAHQARERRPASLGNGGLL